MLTVRKHIQGTSTKMLLNVHDELVFEIPTGDRALVQPIRGFMETSLPLKVPVEVDAKIGFNWNEMKAV